MYRGFNGPRPTKEDYTAFLAKFVSAIESLQNQGISFMVFGSYLRGDLDIGRSDIDATLIFPNEVVINKEELKKAGSLLAKILTEHPVKFQVTVTDNKTMQDPRFNSYNPTFEDYFRQEGLVLAGPDYRPSFRYGIPVYSDQPNLVFNLRKVRQGLLFSEHMQRTDYERFLEKFEASLDGISRGSKQVLGMIDGKVHANRFSALNRIKQEFPNVDTEALERIKFLYTHLTELDAIYHKPEEAVNLWSSGLTFFEELLCAYIQRFPV